MHKNRLLLIREGTVEIWHTRHDLLVKTIEPGTLFGNMPLLGQVMIGTKAISGIEGSVIAEVTPDTARGWMKSNPPVIGMDGNEVSRN